MSFSRLLSGLISSGRKGTNLWHAAGSAPSLLSSSHRAFHVMAPGHLTTQHLALLRRAAVAAGRGGLCRGFSAAAAGPASPKAWGKGPPVSMRTVIVLMMFGAGGLTAVNTYKDDKVQKVTQSSQQTVGKAAVGGPFSLIDQDRKRFSERDLLGEFTLVYFGFTTCPDICPDELEKLAEAIDKVEANCGVKIKPLFITVDPERDTPERVKAYIKEFHPRMVGLTGTMAEVKAASKQYRVYFSKTNEEEDYLVDHSIIHYLLNPEGDFVTFYGKSYTPDGLAQNMLEHCATWQKDHPAYNAGRLIKAPLVGEPLPPLVKAAVKA